MSGPMTSRTLAKKYHKGYQDQIRKWEIRPLDKITEFVKNNSERFRGKLVNQSVY
jgi:hypothetical protein